MTWCWHRWTAWTKPQEYGFTYLTQTRLCVKCGRGSSRTYDK